MRLKERDWVPEATREVIAAVVPALVEPSPEAAIAEVERLAALNRQIHDVECINLDPAANVMSPRAEALMAAGLGSRPSLGLPGAKYETGLEAIERIEVIAAELAARVFDADFVEVRVPSGALANLYAFMAAGRPGDRIIVPPAAIGGHVTHHGAGAAGLYGFEIHEAPVAADGYTVDLEGLSALAETVRPVLITIGGSLNLTPHPVGQIREIADKVGARVLFDAAHLCGMIAGGVWANPLAEGAHMMSMSTYKSLGGPPGGLLLSNNKDLAQNIESIAFPGLTANHDAGRVAALAVTLADWRAHGGAYAQTMAGTARALVEALEAGGMPVYRPSGWAAPATISHQIALEAARFGGGQAAARRLRRAGILACGIGLPVAPVPGDMNGLRLGVPEVVRIGMGPGEMPELAALIARGLSADPEAAAGDVAALRQRFGGVRFATL